MRERARARFDDAVADDHDEDDHTHLQRQGGGTPATADVADDPNAAVPQMLGSEVHDHPCDRNTGALGPVKGARSASQPLGIPVQARTARRIHERVKGGHRNDPRSQPVNSAGASVGAGSATVG
jgi:hypothetical protein